MKAFVKNIIVYGCFIFCIAMLFQILLSLKISGKSVSENDNLDLTSNINADLLFLGSSRCWAHFDPYFFDKTYKIRSVNIGVNGHSELTMAIVRLKHYLSGNRPPKFVILSFDPFISAGSETNNTNFFLKNEFARYSFFPSTKDLLFVNYFKFNFAEKYIPLYSIFKYRLLDDCISIQNNDFNTTNSNHINDELWDTIAKPIHKSAKKYYFNDNQIDSISKALGKLNNLCSKSNIKLICIQTPVYKSIYDNIAFTNTRLICRKLNVPFVDVNEKFFRNNINLFYNSNHLNKKGVEQMNQFFKKNVLIESFFKNN